MGDTDATLTTGALAGPGAGSADGNTTGTRGGASTSEPGVGGAAKADVKTEVEQRSGPNVRLPLKQAVELEMGHLDAALERIDSDIVFMHNLVDRRREYLVGALQRLKINRDMSIQNEMGRYKYLIETSKRNTRRLRGIASETPLRALRVLPSVQERVSENVKYANKSVLEIETNECSKVLMYGGLDRHSAPDEFNSLWKRNRSHYLTDLGQCEVCAEIQEGGVTAGTSCTLTVTARCKAKDSQLCTMELIIRSDENPCTVLQVDGKWRRTRENGNETQVLKAKIEFPSPGSYTLYAQAPFNESVSVKTFTVEPSLKRVKEDTKS